MISTFIECVSLLFKDEGGYVNDASDPGGETKYGISKRAYPNENIKELSFDRARALYKKDYWEKARCEELNEEIRYIHFDTAVNMGIRVSTKLLQKAAGLKDDGIFGQQTLLASKNVTLKRYAEERIIHYNSIISANPKLEKFRKGWMNRVDRIVNIK